MPKNGVVDDEKLEDWIKFRVTRKMKEEFQELASFRQESEADLGRKIVQLAIEQGLLENALDEVIKVVRESMRDAIKPTEERLAALSAKTAISSATAMYLNVQTISNAGYDAKGIYEESRKKAVVYVKGKG